MARRGKVNKKSTVDDIQRPVRWRRYDKIILIVCEDQKTEPFYFNQYVKSFPEETLYLHSVGTGRNTIGVVNEAVKERLKLGEKSRKNVDETWVVFDRDDCHKSPGGTENFNQAFESNFVNLGQNVSCINDW